MFIRTIGKRRAWIATLMLLTLLFTAACSNSGKTESGSGETESPPAGSNAAVNGNQPTQEAITEVKTFKMMVFDHQANKHIPALLILPQLTKALAEQYGVAFELIAGGPRDNGYFQNVDLKIATGDIPDALYLKKSQAEVYGSQGALLDLAPLIKQNAPNLQKFMDENSWFEQYITNENGQIFSIPWLRADKIPNYAWLVRQDWLDQLKLNPPTSPDELENFLKTLKAENPGKQKNFYPLAFEKSTEHGSLVFAALAYSFGAEYKLNADGTLDGIYNIDGNGTNYFSPGFKNLIAYMNRLYTEGLLDPESANFLVTEDILTQKMVTGNAAVTYRTPNRGFEWQEASRKADPAYTIEVFKPFKNADNDEHFLPSTPSLYDDFSMSVNAKTQYADTILKFIDYFFTEEGATLNNWGIEGQSYRTTNGVKEVLVKFEDTLLGDKDKFWGNMNKDNFYFISPADSNVKLALMNDQIRKQTESLMPYVKKVPMLKLTSEQQLALSELKSKYQEKGLKWIADFVTGKKPMADWDQFLADMKALGYLEASDIWEAAYQKYLKSQK